MILPIFDYWDSIHPLTMGCKQFFIERARKSIYDPRTRFIRANSFCDELTFIEEGLVRVYHLIGGDEKTVRFIGSNGLCLLYDSFFHKTQSIEGVRTVQSSTFLSLSRENLDRMYERFPEFYRITDHYYRHDAMEGFQRLYACTALNHVDRFRWLNTVRADLIGVVPDKYLSEYLNMTSDHYGRIKNGHVTEKKKRND
jgi:hypothetical protein